MRYLITSMAVIVAVPAPAFASEADYRNLLEADRAWSALAQGKSVVDGLSEMFDRQAVLVTGGTADLVRGPAAIRAKLAERPGNDSAGVEWSPVGGGISADGSQGFTYGALTVRPKDGAAIPQKYLSYWVKRPEGWRVFAYKRIGRRQAGPLTAAPPVLGRPGRRGDNAAATLKAAEKAFSDEAQRIGLRAAFQKWGRPDSVNIGAAETIAIGAQAIGEGVAGPEPGSPVSWAADEVLVAASGDMGLSYGVLHFKTPPPGQPSTIPFMTIWARPRAGDPWRYVAE